MPFHNLPNIKRGRMSAEEKAEIERLAVVMAKPTAGQIAAKLNRHPQTVTWFMLTRGLIERKAGRAPYVYSRNGKTIHPYTEEQDTRLESLRVEGKTFREIAVILTREFGIERNAHGVHVRLVLLTAVPDCEVA